MKLHLSGCGVFTVVICYFWCYISVEGQKRAPCCLVAYQEKNAFLTKFSCAASKHWENFPCFCICCGLLTKFLLQSCQKCKPSACMALTLLLTDSFSPSISNSIKIVSTEQKKNLNAFISKCAICILLSIDHVQKGRLTSQRPDFRSKSICVSQHQCSNMLAMVHSSDN